MVSCKNKINILQKSDANFPWRLRILKDCPDVLYVVGNCEILNDFSIAIVGSRKCDEYGKYITRKFAKKLAEKGVCVVSGLAEGVDTCAHEEALNAKGKTIAVLGGGFEKIFPKSNEKLFEEIIENGGAVISEYMPNEYAKSINFPRRNRIVACMSEGILVTQAREKSGALITANIGMKYNKKIFTVPSNLENDKNDGNHYLIRGKAKLVFNEKEILKEFKYFESKEISKNNEIPEIHIPEKYERIYAILSYEPIQINEICRRMGNNTNQVLADLTMLEMQGYVTQLPGGNYVLK